MKDFLSAGKWEKSPLDMCGIMYGCDAKIDVSHEVTMRKIEALLDEPSSLHYFQTQTGKKFLDEIL